MRLLFARGDPSAEEPLDITLCEFFGSNIPPYAILSHRWREDEVLFADMVKVKSSPSLAKAKKGYQKLEACCRVALQEGVQYIWNDTCCIDKTSSVELSEAINSMFNYYSQSELCIAFLDDIEDDSQIHDTFLARAIWFSRGWTLQELIAPKELHYYSRNWKFLGTKISLSKETSLASGIDESVLEDCSRIKRIAISEKMSWAGRRRTTREEDEAYSLMGLFGVNMPPLYGEGRVNAFRRLQLEILHTNPDHTLFAWNSDSCTGDMLAPSVSHFIHGNDYEPTAYGEDIFFPSTQLRDIQEVIEEVDDNKTIFKPDYNMTNAGLHIQLPIDSLPMGFWGDLRFAFLRCRTKHKRLMVAICLQKRERTRFLSYSRVSFDGNTTFRFDRSLWNGRRLPITKFNPIWISETNVQSIPRLRKIPPSVEGVRFELWVKAQTPFSQIHWNRQLESATSSDKPARESRPPEGFYRSPYPVRYSISGSIPITGFNHEVVALRGKKEMDFAFGVIDRNIWFHAAAAGEHLTESTKGRITKSEYDVLFGSYSFPGGITWQNRHSNILLLNGSTAAHKSSKKDNTARCDIEVLLSHGWSGTLLLRIYVVSTNERVW